MDTTYMNVIKEYAVKKKKVKESMFLTVPDEWCESEQVKYGQ